MYSTSTSQAAFPQYVDYSTSPSRPQYRTFPQVHQENHTRSVSSISGGGISLRATNTQDLATFLRESSPKDFQKYLKKSSSESQLFSFGSSYKKSLKFLRTSASKTKLKQQQEPALTLPNTVRAKKTIRGRPYLQIHVDYDKTYCQTQVQSPATTNNRFSAYGISEFSSDFASRDSRPTSGAEDRPSLSPAPLGSSGSTKTLDTETAETYQRYINAEQDPDAFTGGTEASAGSPSIEAVGGGGVKASEYRGAQGEVSYITQAPVSCKHHSDLHSHPAGAQNTISVKARKRSSSLRRTSRGSYSSRSSVYSTGDELADTDQLHQQRKHSRRAPPPRPGPPPARCLPALPETHDCASVTTARDSVAPRSLMSTSASIRSSTSCGKSSHYHTIDEATTLSQERTTREQRVNARKARDIQQARLWRQGKMTQPSMSTLNPNGTIGLHIVTSGKPVYTNRQSSGSKASSQTGKQRTSQMRVPTEAPTPPLSPNTHHEVHRKSVQSSSISSSKSFFSQSDAGSDDMESRIQAVERKNRMLEKMLIAVIRGSVGQDHRQAELQKANSVDDLLRQLTLVEASPSANIVRSA
ncbi:hypothetical protein BDD12DRAFT_41008 [Trichophaea hybrida]|nr:hypothetical protein BDD12DRAFT_41008 [Trichophaea hybrida]